MSKRMILLLGAAVVVFGGLIGAKLFLGKMMNQYLDNMPIPPVTVSAGTATADSWVRQVTAVGTVTAVQGAELTTQVSGIVESIHFDSGSQVNAGDIILTLDYATDNAELKTLKAAERLAQVERDRVRELWQRKSISQSEYDQRESTLEQAQAQVAVQQSRIEQKILRAPYAGRLGIRQVNIGEFVDAGDPMIGLQSLDPIFVDFTLPEQRYSDILAGMQVSAQMDALGNTVFTGTISAIEPVIDADTRNFKVRATFANPEERLRPGMFARISINIGEARQVIIIPRTAISYKPYGNSVYVLTPTGNNADNGNPLMDVTQRFISTGDVRGDLIAVTKGLEVGETIATSGLLKLNAGVQATLNNAIQPAAEIAPTPDNG